MLRILEDDLRGPEIAALLGRHLAGMHEHSPPGAVFAFDIDRLRGTDVTFWSAWDETDGVRQLAGCGALKELDPTHGEIKSMRTADAHLRKGVGAAILSHIIGVARGRGYTRLSLETGSGPAFEAAARLYERFGFVPCGAFGPYVGMELPFSRFYSMGV